MAGVLSALTEDGLSFELEAGCRLRCGISLARACEVLEWMGVQHDNNAVMLIIMIVANASIHVIGG